jgi:hypothetical protein
MELLQALFITGVIIILFRYLIEVAKSKYKKAQNKADKYVNDLLKNEHDRLVIGHKINVSRETKLACKKCNSNNVRIIKPDLSNYGLYCIDCKHADMTV